MSHVLVSAPFESSAEFFYPTPYRRVISVGANKLADAIDARVTLADIPFVALRHGLPDNLLRGRASYLEAVLAVRRTLQPPELVIDLAGGRVRAAGQLMQLPRAELALLAAFARRAQRGDEPIGAPPKDSPDAAWGRRYRDELRQIAGPWADNNATEQALRHGMDGEYFSMHLSRLRKCLARELGPTAVPYRIDDGNTRPKRYRLALQPQQITFASLTVAPGPARRARAASAGAAGLDAMNVAEAGRLAVPPCAGRA